MKIMGKWNKRFGYTAVFLAVNLIAILLLGKKESFYIQNAMAAHGEENIRQIDGVMNNYIHSFQLFSHMMARETEDNRDPDDVLDYLKSIDSEMLDIEGDTFDGLYMYYQGRYLYSWDTPYSEYESTGYTATERPWYKDAAAGKGDIVFTPPYMSYANHYILSTISQLQPDQQTVFAYDIKMGNIQNLVSSLVSYDREQMMIFDDNGTVIGSTNSDYLGGNLWDSLEDIKASIEETRASIEETGASIAETGASPEETKAGPEQEHIPAAAGSLSDAQTEKLKEQIQSAEAFLSFRKGIDAGLSNLLDQTSTVLTVKSGNSTYFGYLQPGNGYHSLTLVPVASMLKSSVQIWLVPLLLLELLLFYILGRISKDRKNRELKAAYIELGQTQRRLELALSVAQKAAAIDDLTGMMNFKSFRKNVAEYLNSMEKDESGILIMLDGDRFKAINDNYGHSVGDEVIKLSAQMIVGRIRTIDLASRLHGDEFAIFVSKTEDYSVAKRIIDDINHTIAAEASRRNMPPITLSAGAVTARQGDSYSQLIKAADAALYRAKATHNGGFSYAPPA